MSDAPDAGPAVARLRDVRVRLGGAQVLAVDALDVDRHTVVLGPNGAGKTTLLRLLAGRQHPHEGTVDVLGERLGATDVRELRRRIGLVSVALDPLTDGGARVDATVAAALDGATTPWTTHAAPGPQLDAALAALARVGVDHLAARHLGTCSQGELQRVRLARALVLDPELLLLDEPFAGLDVAGRETLLADLDALLRTEGGPVTVLVVHHLEEVPSTAEVAVLLRGGGVAATGGVGEVLAPEPLSACFGLDLDVHVHDGRRTARARAAP